MEDTLADDFELIFFGNKTPMTKERLIAVSFETGIPWRDVKMMSEIYAERSAAIYYRGVNTVTGEPVFVSEHLELDNDLRIKKAHTMVFPRPT
ncbi:MAG: hypothetical protein ACTSX7_19305 [Alphaproteobacteria bacterium]